ncbi:FMN-binding negative transcriptional regulator [Maribacter sp. ANRC-HE7]|uniref:FMN-binding negative transcriptional regulator n=1 Tax=Maribacter aquimaris TaxID=2737171 RepID=A0ABR7UZ51_9FLAO|nr:FMN-binding negative transcriptional regulator [Maribacter aquimaris]MBD0776701.1 FMN-binding negative transcriptional regulator [Maribacter aquimaris]
MYIPHQYKNEDIDEVKDFITKNSFGILVNQVEGKPWATHIPLELDTNQDGKDVLVSHISKANPQWKQFAENDNVLCIFNGPHSYVSSSWYKEEEVPTWNYIAVHVYGKIKILTEEEVLASMHKLVDKYERHSENPISMDHLSEKTLRQVKGVVGFQITIDSIQAAYKLSQGRKVDHPRIISELEKTENQQSKDIAKRMKD